MTSEIVESLLDALRVSCTAEGTVWLEQARAELADAADCTAALVKRSAMARRKLGEGRLSARGLTLPTACGELEATEWTVAEAARVVFILTAASARPATGHDIIETLFRRGDESERATIARAMALIDPQAQLLHLILEAGRANSLVLVGAVTLANPYPAAHYSDAQFNQLVLKALFLGLPVARISGLARRANAELSRMCEDYYDERTAARRSVPADIWLALAPHAGARGERLLVEHLSSDDAAHRYYAAIAAPARREARGPLREALAARLARETDPHCLAALRQALSA